MRLDQMRDLPRTARYGDGGGAEVGGPSCIVRCLPLAAPVARRARIGEKDGGGRKASVSPCIAHLACGVRKWGTSRVEGRGRERRLDGLAGSAVDACRDFEARCVQAVTYLESRAVGTLGVDRQGGMGTRGYGPLPSAATIRQSSTPPVLFSKRFPPKSPHPRLFITARARSRMTSSSPPALPSRLQAPCTPIGPQYSLDRISLTVSAFTTCTSSRLFLSGGGLSFRSDTSPAPLICNTTFSTGFCISGETGGTHAALALTVSEWRESTKLTFIARSPS
ncbi:hypothetical protein B0H13DRAFT_2661124 [Mycena leptocephala]|nr:hypothetical protein B0H13DRAFT_2661124 [Mycena leptocephala]